MGESDDKITKVTAVGNENLWKWAIREVKGVGVAAVILAFGMYEWHTLVKDLQSTMTEVRLLMQDVRADLRDHRAKTDR